jgi:hypothetical protein
VNEKEGRFREGDIEGQLYGKGRGRKGRSVHGILSEREGTGN